jgi:RNA polymerase sigma-70 factor (ECF subfamily)
MQVTTRREADAPPPTLELTSDAARHASALERVLDRFAGVALRAGAAHGLRGDDLDEVMQDVRIRIWRAGGGLPKLEALTSSYIYRTAASAAVDMLRRRRARREQTVGDRTGSMLQLESQPTASADARLMSAETLAAIQRAIEDIPVNRRAVVRMYLKGYDRYEIAALLQWSEAKTRNLLYRGLEDLRERLTALGMKP